LFLSFFLFFFFLFFVLLFFCCLRLSPELTCCLGPVKYKVVKGKPKTPTKYRPVKKTVKKAVNYDRAFGQQQVAPPPQGYGGASAGRRHSDTLASMPMQEKMKAFESHGAANSRRDFWIKRAEEKVSESCYFLD
jgi:hypothetical protein